MVETGLMQFHALVVATDSEDDYPVPDGETRQHLAEFGAFPVFLVNRKLEIRATSTQELFPFPLPSSAAARGRKRERSPHKHARTAGARLEEEVLHLHRYATTDLVRCYQRAISGCGLSGGVRVCAGAR